MISKRGETYQTRPEERRRDLAVATIAVIYTGLMIYAGGFKFIVLSAILYAPGTLLYIWSRKEQNQAVFKASDLVILVLLIAAAVFGVVGLVTGYISI
jgi:arginine:ornithine antiporter/lysine permease